MEKQILSSDWSYGNALIGGMVWIILLILSTGSYAPLGTIELLFLLAPLVIVPLGFVLVTIPDSDEFPLFLYRITYYLQPFAATLVVVSFCLPTGITAALFASGWLAMSGLMGVFGLSWFWQDENIWRDGSICIEEACMSTGLLHLPIGGIWLVFSRLGLTPLGFEEPIELLTALHFHYAGFVVPLFTGAIGRMLDHAFPSLKRPFYFVALGVMVSPSLIAAGFVLSPFLKVISVLLFMLSLIGLSVLTLIILPTIHSRLAQLLYQFLLKIKHKVREYK